MADARVAAARRSLGAVGAFLPNIFGQPVPSISAQIDDQIDCGSGGLKKGHFTIQFEMRLSKPKGF